jgi:alkanesulfonate monooxygenase SsuD/methylene tetrahydromethanopterin reductase-like flavin-dependent oxidoreductase (luciferase family)
MHIVHREFGGYGIPVVPAAEAGHALGEACALIRWMWAEDDPFDFAGRYYQLRGAICEPKPVQRPHPPVWVACSRRDTILLAAEKGIGALAFAFVDPEEARQWVADYHATMEAKGVPIGDAVNSEVACVTTFMCHEDEETALARGIAGANFFGYSLAHYYVFGRHQPGVTDVWAEYEQQRAAQGFDPEAVAAAAVHEDRLGAKIVDEGTAGLRGAVGTPDQVREYLRRYEEAGVDQVILTAQAGKNRHEHIMESLELFGREVLPEFKARDEQAARDKARRLEPVIEQVMSRKPASDHPPLPTPDYDFPAIPRAIADRSGSDDFHAWLDQFAEQSAAGDSELQNLLG